MIQGVAPHHETWGRRLLYRSAWGVVTHCRPVRACKRSGGGLACRARGVCLPHPSGAGASDAPVPLSFMMRGNALDHGTLSQSASICKFSGSPFYGGFGKRYAKTRTVSSHKGVELCGWGAGWFNTCSKLRFSAHPQPAPETCTMTTTKTVARTRLFPRTGGGYA